MPELPEVETVKRTLKNFVLGKEIEGIDVYYDKIIEGDVSLFLQSVAHQKIHDIKRRGKYLIFLLDDVAFVSHLRMEGKYNIVPSSYPVDKHTHVVFHLNDNQDLRYHDTRKFGRMQLVSLSHYNQELPLSKLGKEPFDMTMEELYSYTKKSHLAIKTFLLDQTLIAGIGNIYANEICFKMGIDPRTKANRLSKKRVQQLLDISKEILNEAIKQGGTTIHSFDANGIHGLFQVKLHVHGKKECDVCHSLIKKIVLNQRGTYYCPKCQKKRY